MHFAVLPSACVELSVGKAATSKTVFLTIFKITCVSSLVPVLDGALPVVLEFEELTFIMLEVVFKYVSSYSREHIVAKPADKDCFAISFEPNSNAFSAHLIWVCVKNLSVKCEIAIFVSDFDRKGRALSNELGRSWTKLKWRQ